MIPRLYESHNNPTYMPLKSELVAPLQETISCFITEELNGMYELELTYPTTGKWFNELMAYNVLVAFRPYRAYSNSFMTAREQPFYIYKRTIDGDILTVNAHHCSYLYCNQAIFSGFNYPTVTDARTVLNAMGASGSSLPSTTPFVCSDIKTQREYLLDSEYSAASVYGVEFTFDRTAVNYFAHRGGDFGVELRLGKNITSAWAENDLSDSFNGIFPYWEKDGVRVIASSAWSPLPHVVRPTNPPAGPVVPVIMDFTDQFETQPTVQQLEAAAQSYLDTNEPWKPHESVDIGFYPLWQASMYGNTAQIEGVDLGDDVSVYWEDGGLNGTKLRVVKVVYNVLLNRFDEIQLGTLEKGYVVTSDGKISAVQSSGGGGGGGGVPAIYLTSVPCSAMTGNFVDYNNAAITADYVVAECVFANPSAITTDVTWTTSEGNIKLNGTCSVATTCSLVLVPKSN